MPLPQPSSRDRYSHGIPVLRTNSISVNAAQYVAGRHSVIGDGVEGELLQASRGLQEEVLGPWRRSAYEYGRHLSAPTEPSYARYRPKAHGNNGSMVEMLLEEAGVRSDVIRTGGDWWRLCSQFLNDGSVRTLSQRASICTVHSKRRLH